MTRVSNISNTTRHLSQNYYARQQQARNDHVLSYISPLSARTLIWIVIKKQESGCLSCLAMFTLLIYLYGMNLHVSTSYGTCCSTK